MLFMFGTFPGLKFGTKSVAISDVHEDDIDPGVFAQLVIQLPQHDRVRTLVLVTHNTAIPQSVIKGNYSTLSHQLETKFKIAVITTLRQSNMSQIIS